MRTIADVKKALEIAHKLAIKEAMGLAGLNISKMAKGMGMSRTSAYKYLKEHYGDNFHAVLVKELMVPKNTAQDIIKLTKD